MSKPDPQWQRTTALRHVASLREQKQQAGQVFTNHHLAEAAANYVGSDVKTVLRWMAEQPATTEQEDQS